MNPTSTVFEWTCDESPSLLTNRGEWFHVSLPHITSSQGGLQFSVLADSVGTNSATSVTRRVLPRRCVGMNPGTSVPTCHSPSGPGLRTSWSAPGFVLSCLPENPSPFPELLHSLCPFQGRVGEGGLEGRGTYRPVTYTLIGIGPIINDFYIDRTTCLTTHKHQCLVQGL